MNWAFRCAAHAVERDTRRVGAHQHSAPLNHSNVRNTASLAYSTFCRNARSSTAVYSVRQTHGESVRQHIWRWNAAHPSRCDETVRLMRCCGGSARRALLHENRRANRPRDVCGASATSIALRHQRSPRCGAVRSSRSPMRGVRKRDAARSGETSTRSNGSYHRCIARSNVPL